MGSREVRGFTINTFREYGQWLTINLKSGIPKLQSTFIALKKIPDRKYLKAQIWQKMVRGYRIADDFVEKKIKQGYRTITHPFVKMYRFVFSLYQKPAIGEKPEILRVKEGVVIVPSTGKDEETKKKIKEAFSDEVKVEPKDETSGIITPIFKEREGQEYLYIMVPVTD